MKSNLKHSSGMGMVEILIALGIMSLVLASLATLGSFSLKVSGSLKRNIIATNLASEAIEAAKAVQGEDWNIIAALSLGSAYHPIKTGTPLKWSFGASSENISGFSRQVIFSAVNRDASDNIVASGGTLDSQTKKATAIVSWNESGQNKQVVLTAYLMNWRP